MKTSLHEMFFCSSVYIKQYFNIKTPENPGSNYKYYGDDEGGKRYD